MQKIIYKFLQSIVGKMEREEERGKRQGLSSTGREVNICDNPCSSSCSEIDYVTGSCMHAIMLSCINLSSLATTHVALPHDKASYMLRRISFFPSRAATFIVCSAFGRFSQFLKDLVKLVALCTKPLNPKNNLAMEDQHGVVHISEVNTKYLSIASMISCKQLHQPVE